MKTVFRGIILIAGFLLVLPSYGQIKLPSVIGDNMVLQQNAKVSIWGWGNPGTIIKVCGSWNNDTVSTKISNQSEWSVKLSTSPAGGPYTVALKGNETVILKNVMIGEVWICSGQSNMEWSADSKINNGEEEIKNANHPDIRLFHVKKLGSDSPQDNCFASWETCSPETMHSFSAIGYFFARDLQEKLNVPVGIIEAAWGGTPAEVWVRKEIVWDDPLMNECARKLRKYDSWPSVPGVVYNGMIAPITNYRIAGAIWYQGESNADNPESYRRLFGTLIRSWRQDFRNNFPFYYVQIAPYSYGKDTRAPLIREMQMQTMDIPKTGMVVVSDLVDDVKNIHPRDKQDVGKRLADWALGETYGIKGLTYRNPLYKSMSIEKNKIRISFDNVPAGLKSSGKEITAFEIAGADKVFKPANVKIDGNTVLVWSKEVKIPVAVRFSFSNDAIGNLFNSEGLPVAPFRTDDWEY
jgi:sialate O-acetylesterase